MGPEWGWKPAFPRVFREVANQLSIAVVIAFCVAVTGVAGQHIARHYGYQGVIGLGHPMPGTTPAADSTNEVELQQEADAPDTSVQAGNSPQLGSSPGGPASGAGGGPGSDSKGMWIPILTYHHVGAVSPRNLTAYTLSVAPNEFRTQMQYLKDQRFTTLTMRQVDDILMGKKPPPSKPVALTFDDGYVDFYTAAAPVLREFGLTATEFVPTQLAGDARRGYMTWPMLQELDKQGFEIAAHTQLHIDLNRASEARQRTEIFGAKADLEKQLGHEVVDWAYPYGAHNPTAMRLVKEAGFISAATIVWGGWHDVNQMPELTRIAVNGGNSEANFEANIAHP
jgi:peptidoglycan/xylan/chitin deacetylase (PgdA/CDA1 family)